MKRRAIILLLISIGIVVLGYAVAISLTCDSLNTKQFFCPDVAKLAKYYEDNIRGHLFAGFLALGGFLLSLKTFIVVNMKENVYDNEKYQENWRDQKKIKPDLKLYAPLKELSDLLFYAILAAIVSAILQMTLGLYSHWLAALICLSSAVYAVVLLVASLVLIKQNLDTWFSHLEK